MYENLCGNCVGGVVVELTFDFFFYNIAEFSKLCDYDELSQKCRLYRIHIKAGNRIRIIRIFE
jgi:hypothetical protein